jgi:hypothetical protein
MAMATVHIAQGLDGKPSLWPVNAVSRDRNGVFKDIRGRIVKAPADRLGAAMDSAQPAKRRKPVGKDTSVEDTLIRRLLPTLKKMADESFAEDDAESEQQQYGESEANDEELNEQAGIVNVSEQNKTRLDWLAINERNRAGRGRAYAPVAANASKGH